MFYHIPFKFNSSFANMMEVDEKMPCSILNERFRFKKHPDGNIQKTIVLCNLCSCLFCTIRVIQVWNITTMQNTYDDVSSAPDANDSFSNQTYKATLEAFIPFFFHQTLFKYQENSLCILNSGCSPSYSSNLQLQATHTNERLWRLRLKWFQWCAGYLTRTKTEQIYTRRHTP